MCKRRIESCSSLFQTQNGFCKTQNLSVVSLSATRKRLRLTAQGERARGRIGAASDDFIHQRRVACMTVDDVTAAADVSGSQRYEYFPDEDDLVQAVLDYQADTVVNSQRRADFGNVLGLRAWRGSALFRGRRGCVESTGRGPDWRRG